MKDLFGQLSRSMAGVMGSPLAFLIAALGIVMWALSRPVFGFSDTWQLVVNTTTTIITFLMVFIIQNTQNRDAQALHVKLDELIRAVNGARDKLVDVEDGTDGELTQLTDEFKQLRLQHTHTHG